MDLPAEMQGIHDVFHLSTLKKSFGEKPVVMEPGKIRLQPNLSCEEWPVQIVDPKEQELRNRKITLVKVLWNNLDFQEATWEWEDSMRSEYPRLFVS